MAKELAPIIIVKKKGKHKHAHHGGSWKVAFADFATAMMAFFLVMWLTSTTTPEEKTQIQNYFNSPDQYRAIMSASASPIVLPTTSQAAQNLNIDNTKQANSNTIDMGEQVNEDQEIVGLSETLRKEIDSSSDFQGLKDQIIIDVTPEGLRIQLIDAMNKSMFEAGGADFTEQTLEILKKLGAQINKMPNKVSISGHTDVSPIIGRDQFSNWELSTERANAARRALLNGGLIENKVARIVGLGPTQLFNPEEPNSPTNRRISIIVLNKKTAQALASEGEVPRAAVKAPSTTP